MLLNSTKQNGIYYVTEKKDIFSSVYITVRDKEQRIYDDHIVARLPKVLSNHKYYNEWKLRQKSTKRIVDYLTEKNTSLKILDLGCGNGWFSNQLSKTPNSDIYAIDINHTELEQAARVFQSSNLKFIYADIFSSETDNLQDFDIITVNSCIQYFEDLEKILSRLKSKLNSTGELHIIDSPFYKKSEITLARNRTTTYYKNLGVPKMIHHYFHHEIEGLQGFEILYNPRKKIMDKLLRREDSPFMWLMFSNTIHNSN
ncbi:methyltransferase domain-containing protein [Aquimarina sp. 2201CG14-23]|uniref:methyltransferase domain-containing protein n=1 Tax=Aquimarina mycalae TaxID=3040073 RepID=UPI0024782DBE|nr:methyltransferase domain-containing protein [Aquimarina sp. 2201CG14-23]MDH7448057.1 methyltransferase domain-containing protein [Aquimarina sp. 2201CG14-23]